MDVKLVDHGKEGELIIIGSLDARVSGKADELFRKMSERFTDINLNMKDMEYISSAGIRTIRNLYISVNKNGGKLTLSNVNENVMEVFEITGLAGLLNIK